MVDRAGPTLDSDLPPPAAAFDPAILHELLSRLAFLQQQGSEDELGYYLHGIERLLLPPRTVLYQKGRRVERIYLLLQGRVEEVRSSAPAAPDAESYELRLREAGPGTLLGLYDLVYRLPHSTTARTMDEVELIVLEAAQVNRLLYRYPELRAGMLPGRIINRLRTLPLLASADLVAISYLAEAIQVRTYAPGDTIYQAGDQAERLYFVHEGQVRLDYLDARQIWLGNGADFGYSDRALAIPGGHYELDHNAVAVAPATLYSLPRRTLTAVTGINPERVGERLRRLRVETIEQIGVFSGWSHADRVRLLGSMSHYHIPHSHLLTQQDEVADSLWILLPGGQAAVHALTPAGDALPETRMEGPSFFGEAALREQTLATATLEAEAGSGWLRLHWQDFKAFLNSTGRPDLAAQLRLEQPAPVEHDRAHERRYSWLEQGERVVIDVRRHWIAAVSRLLPAFVSTGLLGWLLLLIGWARLGTRFWWTLAGVLAVAAVVSWVWGIADYINDYLVITNLRAVRQEKVILVKESRQMSPLERVQDVQFRQGFWGNILGYADITIQTPGSSSSMVFDRVAHFEEVAAGIKKARDRRRKHYQATGKKQIYSALESRFGVTLDLPSRVWRPAPSVPSVPPPVRPAQGAALHWLARLAGIPREGGGRGLFRRGRAAQPAPPPSTGERYVWHKHWMILLRATLPPLLLTLLLAALGLFLWLSRWAGALTGSALAVNLFLTAVALFWLWWQIEDWRNDIYILEREQLIDIEREPLGFETHKRTANLSDIVDIQMRVPSPLHYIFNFGSVVVQTAATEGQFTFDSVSSPHEVVETIRRRMDQNRQAEERRQALQRAQEFPDWLEVYSRLDPNRERA